MSRVNRRDKIECPITGKIGYPDRSTARYAAARVGKIFGDKMRIYKCRFCKAIHLTKRARLEHHKPIAVADALRPMSGPGEVG